MKTVITTALVLLMCGTTWCQSERMNRDLEVAAEVLSTLLNRGVDSHFPMFNLEVEGRYVEDMGAIFTLPNHQNRRHMIRVHSVEEQEDDVEVFVPGTATVSPDHDDVDLVETIIIFLRDYGNLLSALDDDDQVIVRTGGPRNKAERLMGWALAKEGQPRQLKAAGGESVQVTAEVKNIRAFDEGRIDNATFADRLVIRRESAEDISEEPELEVFASILHRLFKPDFSKTYYMDSQPWVERLGDMGVTYHIKVYSSSSDGDLHTVTTLGKSGLSQDERNEIVNGMYPQFLESMKESILDYGHTLRNLSDDEMLFFVVNLTECKGCDMPKEIELSIKKSVLSSYRKDDLSLAQAKDRFSLKKLRD